MRIPLTVKYLYSVEITKQIDIHLFHSWNDLSKKQLIDLCRLFSEPKEKADFMLKAAMKLLNMKLLRYIRTDKNNVYDFRKDKKLIRLDAEQVAVICSQLEWLLKESDLTRNKIPVVKRRFKKYYGPSDYLYNMNYDEFKEAENFFLAYNSKKDEKYLNLLVASMYRKKKKKYNPDSPDNNGDKREKFSSFNIERRAKKISGIPFEYKLAVFQFFYGCLRHLSKVFPIAFESRSGGAVYDRVQASLKVMNYITGNDVTKKEIVRNANLYDVLASLDEEKNMSDQLLKLRKNGIS